MVGSMLYVNKSFIDLFDVVKTNIEFNNFFTIAPVDDFVSKINKLHITFLVDLGSMTPELAKIINSQNFREWIVKNEDYFRFYDKNDEVVKTKKLDSVIKDIDDSAILVVQNHEGSVLTVSKMPKTEKEIMLIIDEVKRTLT